MRRILVFALLSLAPLALIGAEDEPPDVGKAYQKQIDRAWEKASEGESPANACAAIKGKVSRLLGGSHDDDVISEARAALDTCDVTLPVHYFHTALQSIESGEGTCVDFMVEVKTQLTAMTMDLGLRDEDADPKREIKETIREKVEAVCPEVAPVVLR